MINDFVLRKTFLSISDVSFEQFFFVYGFIIIQVLSINILIQSQSNSLGPESRQLSQRQDANERPHDCRTRPEMVSFAIMIMAVVGATKLKDRPTPE